jgi:hypothetical protein
VAQLAGPDLQGACEEGRPSVVDLTAVAEVREAAIRLCAVGLEADVGEVALKTIAGDDDRHYHAPDSGDLASIYEEIAQDLMCPGVELWGGRQTFAIRRTKMSTLYNPFDRRSLVALAVFFAVSGLIAGFRGPPSLPPILDIRSHRSNGRRPSLES